MNPFSVFTDYFNQTGKKPKKGCLHIIIQPLILTTGKCLLTFYLSNKEFALSHIFFLIGKRSLDDLDDKKSINKKSERSDLQKF